MISVFPLFSTAGTPAVVHIDRFPAGRAGPALPLSPDKGPDAVSPDRFEIFDHTHAVLLPVPLIELPELPAGEITAVMMVPVPDLFAGGDGTVPVAPPVR